MREQFFQNLAYGRKAYGRFMEPVCEKWGLNMTETDILLLLRSKPELDRAADIAAYRGIAKSLVSMSIAHLEQLGYLCRHTDGRDRRTIRLKLTDAALPTVRDAESATQEFLQRMLQGVSEEELRVYQSISGKIQQNLWSIL